MSEQSYPNAFLQKLAAVQGKRARIVVDHILQHGYITTEDLDSYGYKHPPRAVRDVREQGIPIETFQAKNSQGKTIAAYRFGDPEQVVAGRLGGRRVFSKVFKTALIVANNGRCAICLQPYEERYLQVDHRIPYAVAGEIDADDVAAFMPLCGSCNRAKSWSCEHCENSKTHKDPAICKTCYWASPTAYEHVAMQTMRRVDLVWKADELAIHDSLKAIAARQGLALPEYIKDLLQQGQEQQEQNKNSNEDNKDDTGKEAT